MTPYTYLIGWPEHDKWYYGVRSNKRCHPSEFWVKYKTSSKYVRAFVAEHGDPPIQQIRRTFIDADKARDWENTVLRRMRVTESERWLNKTDNKSRPGFKNRQHSEETRERMRKARAKYLETHDGPNKGKKASEEAKLKMREAKRRFMATEEGKAIVERTNKNLLHIKGIPRPWVSEMNRARKGTKLKKKEI